MEKLLDHGWVHSITSRRRRNLNTEKEKQQKDVGVVSYVLSQQWEDPFNLLMKYKEHESHCYVPMCHKENGETLGS